MEVDDFVAQAANCSDYTDVDELCLKWLRISLRDNGREGQIGMSLLQLVETLLP